VKGGKKWSMLGEEKKRLGSLLGHKETNEQSTRRRKWEACAAHMMRGEDWVSLPRPSTHLGSFFFPNFSA